MIEGLKKGMKPTGKKSLHGKFPKSIADFADSVLWQQLRSGYVKKNTEAVIKAAQDQALRTNWIKANIYGVDCPPLCRLCQSADESTMHIASGCKQLAKQHYMITTQSFPYENHCNCYKKLASRLWSMLFTLTYFFFYIHCPCLWQN